MNRYRKKILVDAHCFDSEYQGSRTFVKEIYRELVYKKDVQFFIAAYDVETLKQHFPTADNIVFLRYRSRSGWFRLGYDIPRLIKKHGIDLAHFQYIVPLVKNCRQIVTIHDVLFQDFPSEFPRSYRLLKYFLYKRSAKKADLITTVSAHSIGSITRHLKVDQKKIHLIPNGVSPDFFTAYDRSQAKKTIRQKFGFEKFILYVSRIEPRKNHFLVLKTFTGLKLYEKGYHLVFLGHPMKQKPGWDSWLDNHHPQARRFVYMDSKVNDAELLAFYRAADVFVYPSKAEGFGIPPLEAAAVRIPVICSNRAALREYSFFENNHIDPEDEEEFRERLLDAVRQEPHANRLEAIAEKVKKKYCWKTSAERLYQLIINH